MYHSQEHLQGAAEEEAGHSGRQRPLRTTTHSSNGASLPEELTQASLGLRRLTQAAPASGSSEQQQKKAATPDWNAHDMRIALHWAADTSYEVPWEQLASEHGAKAGQAGQAGDRPEEGTWQSFKDRIRPWSDAQLGSMVKCVNDKHDPSKNITWAALMSDMGSLRVGAAWWATFDRAKESLTLVTASTLNRLNQVAAQCQSWAGPYSVALYHPLLQAKPGPLSEENKEALRDSISKIFQFVAEMKQVPGACQPDVLLVYEVFTDPYAKLLFPINILRNLARVQARTPLVALLDVDLVVSQSLYARMQRKDVVDTMVTQSKTNRTVYILPAFEVNKGGEQTADSAAWADVLALATKDAMSKSLKNAVTIPFDLIRSYSGHKLTNFKHWMKATVDYRVEYEDGCEPWVLGHRDAMPWFDPRYRGYGYNKIQHLAILGETKYNFVVLHDSYCVHRAHKKSEVSAAFSDAALLRAVKGDLHSHNQNMFKDQMAKLKAQGKFEATLSEPTRNCMQTLPWWKN